MKKALLAVAAVSMAGYGVYHFASDDAPKVAHDDDLVTDRLWVDHLPRNDRDTIQIFAAITDEPIGIFQAASMWKGQFELFRFESHGDEFRLVYPQNGEREKLRAKARECSENGMDYCLEIKGSSRGVKKYYSMEGWELGSLQDAQALTAKITKQ